MSYETNDKVVFKYQGEFQVGVITGKSNLKDNKGNFNCGKPAGYIKDFKALPVHMQDLSLIHI